MAHSCHELVIPAQGVLDGSARITLHAGNFRSSQVSVGESGESVSVGERQQSPPVTGGKANGGRRRESPFPARGLRSLWKVYTHFFHAHFKSQFALANFKNKIKNTVLAIVSVFFVFFVVVVYINNVCKFCVLMLVALISAHSSMNES